MRKLIGVAVAALLSPAVQAQEFSTPQDLLSTLYGAYLAAPITNLEPYFSARLTAEMAGARLDSRSLQRLGLDPFMGTDEPSLVTLFNLKTLQTKGLTATSVASFRNRGTPVSITFELVFEDQHGWQIDHISGQSGELTWCSSDLVAAVKGPSR